MGSLATSLLGAIDRFQPVHNARFVLYSPSAGIFQADELDRIRDGELTLSDIIEASSKNISLERLRSDRSEAPQDPGSDVLHTGKHELNRTYVPESGCFWLDVTDPSPEEMRWLTRKFGIHPSTIEVILAAEETLDTFETFPDYNFLTYWTVDYKGESKSIHEFNQGTDRVVKACCSIVIMESCVLTFHGARNLSHLGNVIDRLRRLADPQTHQMPPLTPAYIAYALIDDITDMLVRL
ncbi:CorA metal ion transporter, partial [Linderina macrospora]